ncbi:hypothetical protein B4144_4030 [Bacillus atrophaeus]|nr:hypothetical protein B4144_4030 [Bacillus atrophaeus]
MTISKQKSNAETKVITIIPFFFVFIFCFPFSTSNQSVSFL